MIKVASQIVVYMTVKFNWGMGDVDDSGGWGWHLICSKSHWYILIVSVSRLKNAFSQVMSHK